MALRFKLQLVAVAEDGQEIREDVAVLDKAHERIEQLGLSLAEAKALLSAVQRRVVESQVAVFLAASTSCPACGRARGVKDHKTIWFRTLFGKLALASPRLRHCPCQPHERATVSPLTELLPEHVAPELRYLETKWASLVSYGLTVQALRDFLPVDQRLNPGTIRNHTLSVARRCDNELGDEPATFVAGCQRDWDQLPPPDKPILVGLDGGYLRDWDRKHTKFPAIVGKVVPTDRPATCFGLVRSYDTKPKRRLHELLRVHGLQPNQDVTFLTDGETSLKELPWFLHPHSRHMLDWFHVTMRLTVIGQCLKGLVHRDPVTGAEVQEALEHTKWNLWHGRARTAMRWLSDVELLMYALADDWPKFLALRKAVEEFQRYLEYNAAYIPNYAERWRTGQVIATAFVESTVDYLLSKRFAKKQQMQWTAEGAHLLLQTRTRTLNGDLAAAFRSWYPAFSGHDHPVEEEQTLAA